MPSPKVSGVLITNGGDISIPTGAPSTTSSTLLMTPLLSVASMTTDTPGITLWPGARPTIFTVGGVVAPKPNRPPRIMYAFCVWLLVH